MYDTVNLLEARTNAEVGKLHNESKNVTICLCNYVEEITKDQTHGVDKETRTEWGTV